jgi:pimeloyl-ACP methyl ester carboxylesterase
LLPCKKINSILTNLIEIIILESYIAIMNTDPIRHTFKSNQLNITAYEWPGDSPPILLLHATGFHARCWDQVIKHLQGKHIYAIDMMGHGSSDKPHLPLDWNQYTDNVIDFIKAFNLTDITGVGHSMGGYLVTEAAAELKGRFKGLVLIDPIIFLPGIFNAPPMDPEDFRIARRRNSFETPQAMFDHLYNKGNFSLWDRQVLLDYSTYGLIPNKEGSGYELACPPLIEAATYIARMSGKMRNDIYEQVKKIDIPVVVVRARDRSPEESPFSFSSSPTNPQLASIFKQGRDIQFKQMSHFIPMENPKLTADIILKMSQESSL